MMSESDVYYHLFVLRTITSLCLSCKIHHHGQRRAVRELELHGNLKIGVRGGLKVPKIPSRNPINQRAYEPENDS